MSLTKDHVYSTINCERLHHFLTHYMKLNISAPFDALELTVLSPDETAHNWWKIILGDIGLAISAEVLPITMERINNQENLIDVYERLAAMINSPTDKSVQLFTSIPLDQLDSEAPLFDDEITVHFFQHIDEKFERLYHYIESEFGFIARSLAAAADDFSRDITKNKIDDIYLSLGVNDDIENGMTFFLKGMFIPPVFTGSRENFVTTTPLGADEKEMLFGYLSRNPEKAKEGITLRYELDAAVKRLNEKTNDFLSLSNDHVGFEREYILRKVKEVLVPSIVMLQLDAFAVFGGCLGDIDKIDMPETEKIKQTVDTFLGTLFTYLQAIPTTLFDEVDHYAIDYDNFYIYARNARHEVIGRLDDPRYTFHNVFGPHHSDGFNEFIKRHLKTIKNKYVFSKLGEITKKPVNKEPSGETPVHSSASNRTPPTLH